jgi:hypothetical protein
MILFFVRVRQESEEFFGTLHAVADRANLSWGQFTGGAVSREANTAVLREGVAIWNRFI